MKRICEWHEYVSEYGGLDFFETVTRQLTYFFVLTQECLRDPNSTPGDLVDVIEKAHPGRSN